jgi:hypothetical protein
MGGYRGFHRRGEPEIPTRCTIIPTNSRAAPISKIDVDHVSTAPKVNTANIRSAHSEITYARG